MALTDAEISERRAYAADMGFVFCEVCHAVFIPTGDSDADQHSHDV